jgi:hypothetical protein
MSNLNLNAQEGGLGAACSHPPALEHLRGALALPYRTDRHELDEPSRESTSRPRFGSMREETSELCLSNRHQVSTVVPRLPRRASEFPFLDAPPTPLFRHDTTRRATGRGVTPSTSLYATAQGRATSDVVTVADTLPDRLVHHACGRESDVRSRCKIPDPLLRMTPDSVRHPSRSTAAWATPKRDPGARCRPRARARTARSAAALPRFGTAQAARSPASETRASPSAPRRSSHAKTLTSIRTVD